MDSRPIGYAARVPRRFPGPFEGILMALGAAGIGLALYGMTRQRWGTVVGALVFAGLMFAAGAWSHSLGKKRGR